MKHWNMHLCGQGKLTVALRATCFINWKCFKSAELCRCMASQHKLSFCNFSWKAVRCRGNLSFHYQHSSQSEIMILAGFKIFCNNSSSFVNRRTWLNNISVQNVDSEEARRKAMCLLDHEFVWLILALGVKSAFFS